MNERYSRQLVLKGFGIAAQEKLGQASVLVIGAGGLGCPALQYLSAAGIGRLGIVDGDRVTLSNLHRQILYTTMDIGKLKAEAATERLKAANSDVVFASYPFFIDELRCLELIGGYDMVLDCSDNFATRYMVNDACALLDKPLVFAAVSDYEGQLAVFARSGEKAERANYRDIFPVQPASREISNCQDSGVLGVLPGIIGTMQAAEAIKLITNIGKPLINQLLHYDLLTQNNYTIDISVSQAGANQLPADRQLFLSTDYGLEQTLCSDDLSEINGQALQEIMHNSSTVIIDVRELHELPALKRRHLRIPLSLFETAIASEIAEDKIVLICQYGTRSGIAAKKLQDIYGADKRIYNLKGGLARCNIEL